jgi:hypothetical protein
MAADPATVAAARQLLDQLGITAADLQTSTGRSGVPTVAEYVTRAREVAGPGARRTYSSYWDRMAAPVGRAADDWSRGH